MRTTIKNNWLLIVLLALVVCFTGAGIASLRIERGTLHNASVYAETLY
ncbi:MAG: hypothetical protein J6R83_03430 [Clostridia bacterium]|nr:hypothetical protein [Clostridia bacterium]